MSATILTIAVLALSPLHIQHSNRVVQPSAKKIEVTQVHQVQKKKKPKPKHKHKRAKGPMQVVASKHHWNAAQVAAAWEILWLESTSKPGHININAVNRYSGCVGAAQFLSWSQYTEYGGGPDSARGQLEGFGNYITRRYGGPMRALAFHLTHGYY